MEDLILTNESIKKRVMSGIVVLGVRKFFFQLILTFGNIVLARIFAPEIFGVFAIISFLVMTLGTLTTFGLPQAIVQKQERITKNQLRAIFTSILFTSLVFTFLIYYLAPVANFFYKGAINDSVMFWLRLFSLYVILINASSVSIALLERNLEYKKLAVGELAVVFVSQGLTIILALRGFGVGSLVLGSLLGNFIGALLFFYFAPWQIGLNFSLKEIKDYFSFGFNFQANSIIGVVNGAVTPGFVGAVSGPTAVGLLNWAGGLRAAGLAPVDVVSRLVFSACARARQKEEFLRSLIEKMIQVTCLATFPLLAAIFALAPQITYIIYTDRWLPGLTALYLSTVQGVFLVLGTILTQVLFALGEARTVRNISLFWAILQWVLTVPLVLLWDFNGAVLAGILVSATFFIPLREVRKKIKINIWSHTLPYLIYSIISGGVMFWLTKVFAIISIWQILFIGLVGVGCYLVFLLLFEREEIIDDFVRLKELVMGR